MNISDYEWLEQVPAKTLSSASLVLITKCTHLVRRSSGRVLSLRDPSLFKNLVEEVSDSNDAALNKVFDESVVGIKSVAMKAWLDVPKHLLNDPQLTQTSSLTYRGVPIE